MPNILRFTPEKLRNLRTAARENPYFFGKALLGYKDLTPGFHHELIQFLAGPGTRKAVCAWRGSLKSSCLRVVIWWKGLNSWEPGTDGKLYTPDGFVSDYSCWYIEQKFDNAEDHHRMVQNAFIHGPQAALLQDMYRHRLQDARGDLIPRWTARRTHLALNDPNAEPFITIGSLDSKLEGGHKHDMFCDDLEGADADVSDVPNKESARFVFNRAEYLLKEPTRGGITIAGTPHGDEPLMWLLKEMSEKGSEWKTFWKPIFNSTGKSHWEERFPTKEYKLKVKIAREVGGELERGVDTQLLLAKRGKAKAQIDMQRVSAGLYEQEYIRLQGATRLMFRYPKLSFNQHFIDPETGAPKIETRIASVDAAACRAFIHADPAHKDKSERITDDVPSKWAIAVVLVAPDWDAFVTDIWAKRDSSVDEFLEIWLRYYMKWAPRVAGSCTFDPVGAQTWIKNHLAMLEKWKYPKLMSLATPWNPKPTRLPRPSTILVESHKHGTGKIENIVHQLQLPLHMGWLHLRKDRTTGAIHDNHKMLWDELSQVGSNDTETFDITDALSQGPAVWQPPPSPEAVRNKLMRERLRQFVQQAERILYKSPWEEPLEIN